MSKSDPRTPLDSPRSARNGAGDSAGNGAGNGDGESVDWRRFVDEYDSVLTREIGRALSRLGLAAGGDQAADLKQETYCRLLEIYRRGSCLPSPLSDGARVTGFLQRVAWSVVVDWLRREMAAKRGGHLQFAPPVDEDGDCRLDWRPSRELDPEQRLLRREEARRVRLRIEAGVGPRRTERDRRIVEMVVLEERTAKEVLRHLDEELTPSGIYAILRRARDRMRNWDRVPSPAAS